MSYTFHSVLEKEAYWDWVAQRAGTVKCMNSRGFIALRDNGDIDAGVAFDNWTKTSCGTHIAIENPFVLRHGFLEEVARYVFDVCDRKIIVGFTPGDNEAALRFNRKIGWVEIARIPDGQDHGVELVIQTMRPDQCRYYRGQANGR